MTMTIPENTDAPDFRAEAAEPVDYPRILYVCEHCRENAPEMCGRARDDLYVTPSGTWLCDECRDEEGVPVSDCVSPPALYPASTVAHLQQEMQRLTEERDEARGIVRDIHWMAVRYADNRKSYAVGMCNDALRKAYDGGWLVYGGCRQHDLDPQYARDGMFDKEWRSAVDAANARAQAAESALSRMKGALEPFVRFIEHHEGPRGLKSASAELRADNCAILRPSPGYPPLTLGDFRRAREAKRYVDANEARIDAEAQLAEARKALDALDRMSRGVDWCEQDEQDEQARRWSAARRAREAQGGENG